MHAFVHGAAESHLDTPDTHWQRLLIPIMRQCAEGSLAGAQLVD